MFQTWYIFHSITIKQNNIMCKSLKKTKTVNNSNQILYTVCMFREVIYKNELHVKYRQLLQVGLIFTWIWLLPAILWNISYCVKNLVKAFPSFRSICLLQPLFQYKIPLKYLGICLQGLKFKNRSKIRISGLQRPWALRNLLTPAI